MGLLSEPRGSWSFDDFPGARFWALHLAAMFGDDAAGTRRFRWALETSVLA